MFSRFCSRNLSLLSWRSSGRILGLNAFSRMVSKKELLTAEAAKKFPKDAEKTEAFSL